MQTFVGIDWGHEAHHVCCEDESGRVLEQRQVKHEATAVFALIDDLIQMAGGKPTEVLVAIETPHGLLVETLIERGVRVFAINPKQLDRFRDRFNPAGAKDDRRDALVLADSLRTDSRAFTEVELAPAEQLELRAHSRLREMVSAQIVQAGNRLDAQLRRYYPQILELGSPSEAWILSLLELAPTPEKGAKLRLDQLNRLLAAHHIRRIDTPQVRAILKAARFPTASGTTEAAAAEVALLIEQLRMFETQLKRCTKQI
jgi:transposase